MKQMVCEMCQAHKWKLVVLLNWLLVLELAVKLAYET